MFKLPPIIKNRPSSKTMENATQVYQIFCEQNTFDEPNVTIDPDVEIVFEWWLKTHKLTLYINENYLEFYKMDNVTMEFEDGEIEFDDKFYENIEPLLGL